MLGFRSGAAAVAAAAILMISTGCALESAFATSPGCTSTSNCESGWNGGPPACGSTGSYLDCHVSGSSCVKYNRNYRNACR